MARYYRALGGDSHDSEWRHKFPPSLLQSFQPLSYLSSANTRLHLLPLDIPVPLPITLQLSHVTMPYDYKVAKTAITENDKDRILCLFLNADWATINAAVSLTPNTTHQRL